MQNRESWLIEDLQLLFGDVLALRNVSIRDSEGSFQMVADDSGGIISQGTSALSVGSQRARNDSPAALSR